VRNVIATGEAVLVKGARRERVGLNMIADDDRPEILKAYLDRYKLTVQRYFPIQAGAPSEAFQPLAPQYPVFEILMGRIHPGVRSGGSARFHERRF
jgi:hypothetical protein